MNPYKKVFSELQKSGVKYLVVGGVAVNLYGYSRFTGDIDILLTLDSSNLSKMEKVMKKLGYVERLPVQLHELKDKKKVKKWLKEKGMTAYTFISSKKPQLDIDILVGYSLDFKKFYKNRTVIKVWGMNLSVISFDDLILMKKKAGREKDLLDLQALLELKSL
ncbi:nucleotidyltransferase [Candidatus Peregrinibacteria bacterium]|nr:nucleotidyltransferase [Candidatus Peregrinibacteria bacterium]